MQPKTIPLYSVQPKQAKMLDIHTLQLRIATYWSASEIFLVLPSPKAFLL